MKKFRGKKRYVRNLWRNVDACNFNIVFDDDSWFDFWHTHLDFLGLGNNNARLRREHIKAHIALYIKLLKKLETVKKPYQSWVCIHEEDTGSDAVYIHTPNPNDDYFPHKMNDVKWEGSIPNTFKDLINLDEYNVGFYKSELEEIFFIQSKYHGIKL